MDAELNALPCETKENRILISWIYVFHWGQIPGIYSRYNIAG